MSYVGRKASFRQEMWIYVGAALFLVALLVSAILDPALRVLHCFQALIYVAVIVLARRNSPWGYGAGFAIAIVWNGMNFFGPHLIQKGAVAFWSWLRTGHVQHLIPMMGILGALGHFILIFATLMAILRHNTEARKWWKFAGGAVLAVGYLGVLVAFALSHRS